MADAISVDDVRAVLSRYHLGGLDERGLQDGIESVLKAEGIDHRREERLSSRDRIDFLVGTVGVEVKISGSLPSILRQLSRYASHDSVTSLLLVSSAPRHQVGFPTTLHALPTRCLIARGRLA